MATLSLSVVFFLGEMAVVAPWNCQPGPTYGGVTYRSTFVSLGGALYKFNPVFTHSLKAPAFNP
jgi:hypothetical protein